MNAVGGEWDEAVDAEEGGRSQDATGDDRRQTGTGAGEPGRQQTTKGWYGHHQTGDSGGRGGEGVGELKSGDDGSHANRCGDCLRHPAVGTCRRGGAIVTHRLHGQGTNGHGCRHQPEEHPSPPEGVGDPAGHERGNHAGQHPARRKIGVDHWMAVLWEGPLDEHVGDGGEAPGADSLQDAPHYHPDHRRCYSGDDQAGYEGGDA